LLDSLEGATRRSVGRKKVNFEQMAARFPEGTLARIDGARRDAETRTTFVQEAVEREIERREKPKP
jgi:predicted DNA-binding protein